jgi:GNAT superfamily N-acetyltransferase
MKARSGSSLPVNRSIVAHDLSCWRAVHCPLWFWHASPVPSLRPFYHRFDGGERCTRVNRLIDRGRAILSVSIRALLPRDIPAATELSTLAGWNQTACDWRMLLELSPEGCFGIEHEGTLAATTIVICYGRQLAWLGMVLTHPDYRRRGFAHRLLEHALEFADRQNVHSVKLDATEQGQPLYERLGFRVEQEVQRWSGTGRDPERIRQPESSAVSEIFAADREAFGADRSRLLQALAGRKSLAALRQNYLLWRPGVRAAYIGPCVAADSESARQLIVRCADADETRWFWDLLPANEHAVALATGFGFRVERRLMRMARGADARGKDAMIYAIAGFELG